jgi:hypothetical protein
LPGTVAGPGKRLGDEGLANQVEIAKADPLTGSEPIGPVAVSTSCSWHYSAHHRLPLTDFIATKRNAGRMQTSHLSARIIVGTRQVELVTECQPRR